MPSSIEQHRETENKYIPLTTAAHEELERYRGLTEQVDQIYLTHPNDPCSLRVRKQGSGAYTATLKVPIENSEACDNTEVEPPITAGAFALYAALDLPKLQKQRAEVAPRTTVDWFDHMQTPLLEVERPKRIEDVFGRELARQFLDVSHEPAYRNSQIAHNLYISKHGRPALEPYQQPTANDQIARLIDRTGKLQADLGRQVVVSVAGGSASGKTTGVAKVLAEETGGTLLSMDDYYMGQAIAKELYDYDLADINFDHPEFYRTRLLGTHLGKLSCGQQVRLRPYQMATAELATKETFITAKPDKPIIVEGIYAGHPDVQSSTDLSVFVNAPMHIRIMRRIMRDHFSGEREVVFKTPGDHLRYLLEVCEPSFATHGAHQEESADIVINT